MNLSPALEKAYTKESLSARDAQRLAEFIAFGPIVFQVSRLMIKLGILDLLRDSDNGMTIDEIACKTGMSVYAVKVLVEDSLTIGTVLVDKQSDKYQLSKTGWFLINDPATRVNIDFNQDVNYEGLFNLEEALKEGKPAGLKHFGDWPTVYEGLSRLPEQVKKSWFAFDHFYSDSSFEQALQIVFANNPDTLLDVGGNTGRWAMRCVGYDKNVNVTIVDLPQQIKMMQEQTRGKDGADRIDCFGEDEIFSILRRAEKIMDDNNRLYIMETLWDRQKYEPAAFCLTQISLYFTAIANGNSKMYNSDDMIRIINKAGMDVETIHDNLGQGHSIIVCKKSNIK